MSFPEDFRLMLYRKLPIRSRKDVLVEPLIHLANLSLYNNSSIKASDSTCTVFKANLKIAKAVNKMNIDHALDVLMYHNFQCVIFY